jgi:hypothetical protein
LIGKVTHDVSRLSKMPASICESEQQHIIDAAGLMGFGLRCALRCATHHVGDHAEVPIESSQRRRSWLSTCRDIDADATLRESAEFCDESVRTRAEAV